MATRDGAEFINDDNRGLPASKNQRQLIEQILRDVPDAKTLFEYEDYQRQPTVENASEFITQAMERALHESGNRDYYVKYIAERPRVEKTGSHGLFTQDEGPVALSRACAEIAEHPGNVWTPIISLRREDAVRLSYDSSDKWQALLCSYAGELAQHMKIHPDNFRWYAAFHNEAHHPHVHMVCYSTNPREGYLTEQGMENIKSDLGGFIFRQDREHIYEQKTDSYKRISGRSLELLDSLCGQIKSRTCDNPEMGRLLLELSDRLSKTGGKKVYGYLKRDVKDIVDRIVDELEKDEMVAEYYSAWLKAKNDLVHTYTLATPERLPLSAQKDFKKIKNMVIKEAMLLNDAVFIDGPILENMPDDADRPDPSPDAVGMPDMEPAEPLMPEDMPSAGFDAPPTEEASSSGKLHARWTKEYKQARAHLFGSAERKPDFDEAYEMFIKEARDGSVLAMHDLGRMHADGLGREIDADAAHEWYAKALAGFLQIEASMDAEDNKATYLRYRIGKMYMAGLGTDQDYTEAASWLGVAADAGHKYAQYSLGSLYYRGLGVERDYGTAFGLYSKSAAQKNAYASYELAKMYRDGVGTHADAAEANNHFKTAYNSFVAMEMESGDDKLQYRIGQMLRDGVGVEANAEEAEYYFERSAELGNPHAQYALAKLYLSGGDQEKIAAAVELLQKSADGGNPTAQYALGKLFRDGEHLEKDIARAVELFIQSAEQKNDYAAYALGKLYLTGEDMPKDVPSAVRWFTESAEQGNQFAQYALGKLYLAGEDVQKNIPAAVRWYTESAEQGNQFAQYALGKLYLAGEDVQKNIPEAVRWFAESAEQGNQFAQYALGKLYLAGEDVQKDIAAAVRWFTESAEQGNQFAQYTLGKLYLAGEDVQKDVQAAIRWLTESAEQGNQFAQYQLGKLYIMGKDVPRDREEALRWLTMAAEQGNEYAQFFIDHIDEFRDPSLAVAATRLLRQLGKIFEQQNRQLESDPSMRIDRKRLRILREKKMAQGHARDDHEPKHTGGV